MSKIKKLVLSSLLLLILLSFTNSASEHSKKQIKEDIDYCQDIKKKERGYVRGIVVKVFKDKWNSKVHSIISNKGCTFVIEHNNHRMLRISGSRIRSIIEVSSDGRGTLLNNQVEEDLSIVDLEGNIPPLLETTQTVPENILVKMKKKSSFTLHTHKGSFRFSDLIISQIKPNVPQTWKYQEKQFGGSHEVVEILDKWN